MTIDVTAVNDAPTANDDTINVVSGTPATGNVVTSNDTDPDGDTLSVSAIAGGSPGSPITGTYGTFTLDSDGSYTYTVDTSNADVIAWQSGDPPLTETFTYTASDGNGETNTATITVNVSGTNDAPTAADNTVTTNEDTDHTFSESEFGFSDVDGDSLDHVSIETLPSNGTLLLDGVAVTLGQDIPAADISNLVFRPAADANGASYDTFTFSVNDGTTDSASTYTMTIDVTAVNDAPTAVDDTDSVIAGGTVTDTTNVGTGTVVSDDSDVDGDTLTVSGTVTQGSATATFVKTVTASGGYFYVDGVQQDTLTLKQGNTYIFNYPSGHPLKFSTTSDGSHGGGTEYTTGVTHNSSTQVTVVVESGAPTLYYYCSSHSGMGAQANIGSPITISSPNSASVGSSVTGYYGELTLDTDGTYSCLLYTSPSPRDVSRSRMPSSA